MYFTIQIWIPFSHQLRSSRDSELTEIRGNGVISVSLLR
jgi:hypothetical protein